LCHVQPKTSLNRLYLYMATWPCGLRGTRAARHSGAPTVSLSGTPLFVAGVTPPSQSLVREDRHPRHPHPPIEGSTTKRWHSFPPSLRTSVPPFRGCRSTHIQHQPLVIIVYNPHGTNDIVAIIPLKVDLQQNIRRCRQMRLIGVAVDHGRGFDLDLEMTAKPPLHR
jgi:hypothetical protein